MNKKLIEYLFFLTGFVVLVIVPAVIYDRIEVDLSVCILVFIVSLLIYLGVFYILARKHYFRSKEEGGFIDYEEDVKN